MNATQELLLLENQILIMQSLKRLLLDRDTEALEEQIRVSKKHRDILEQQITHELSGAE